jgi:hypothetical protein
MAKKKQAKKEPFPPVLPERQPNQSCVYGLREKGTDEFFYVGSTDDTIEERERTHWREIPRNPNKKFANKMKKLGKAKVEAVPLEYPDKEQRFEREYHWVEKLLEEGAILLNDKGTKKEQGKKTRKRVPSPPTTNGNGAPPPELIKTNNRYSDEYKANALILLESNKGNVFQTATQLGIPGPTLKEWADGRVHSVVVKLLKDKKGAMADELRGFVGRVLGLTSEQDIREAPLKERFTALGIAVDKSLLLDGDPTVIQEKHGGKTADVIIDRLRAIAGRHQEAISETPSAGTAGDPIPVEDVGGDTGGTGTAGPSEQVPE